MRGRLQVATAVLMAVSGGFVASCSAGATGSGTPSGSASPAALVPQSGADTTSHSTPHPYGFDVSLGTPNLENRGNDLIAITQSLLAYSSWMEAYRPDSALVPQIAAPASNFDRALHSDIDSLTRYGTRLYEVKTGPLNIEEIDQSGNAASMRVVEHLLAQRLVERSGHIVNERKFTSPTTAYTILIARLKDGRWMLADIEEARSK